ncbi:uncharacterized protein LOC107265737 [Cephus cinctus]|uniref:Uncharacterized protein LOC107265737 n=1 Tax=Cephus cinctus TaxID=211228 RepID=A0AAJ7VZX8_CEPCN|nr:uncharacterized protein LOC107265737 [Cephus cinctus]
MSGPSRLSFFDRLSSHHATHENSKAKGDDDSKRTPSIVINYEDDDGEVWEDDLRGSISSEESAESAVPGCSKHRPTSHQQLWDKDEIILGLTDLPAGEAALALVPTLHGETLRRVLDESKNLNITDAASRDHKMPIPSFVNGYVRKASLAAENEAASAATPSHLLTKWPNTCLLVSCWLRHLELVKALLERGAHINCRDGDGRTPLHLAACSGSVKIVEELLKYGADPAEWDFNKKCTALHCAAAAGDVASVKVLLKSGADVNAGLSGKSPLHYAVMNNSGECVQALLEAGACPNNPQVYTETPLHVAASLGSTTCVKLLLSHGADVRVQLGQAKSTPLHLAAEEGNMECTKLLLEAGAQADAKNSKGQTAMHLAALAQSAETLEVLIKVGANVNAEDSDGRAPLHAAVAKSLRGSELVRMLIQAGAFVNKPDKFGYTALHIAALNESSQLVILLLSKGADVTARTKGGVSALSFIVRRTPDALAIFVGKLDQSISLHDHELGDVDCELRLDFRPLVPGGRGETDLMLCLVEVGQRHVLQHPLCESFLYLKWLRIRKFFLFSLIFHSIFVAMFTAYVCIMFLGYQISLNGIFFWPVLVFTCILACKELFQLAHGIRTYAKRWENWLQWGVILASGAILIQPIREWQDHAAAWGILLVWVELMMVVGRFPMFGLYIQMFTRVSMNFFKFLGAYVCLIIGFSLGFCVFHKNYKSFKNPEIGLLKTIIMMSGELEFEDMFFDESAQFLYFDTAHLMLLAFVILVTVILTNLMVGLAVSDIQELQRCAGLDRLVRRAELVAHLESMLFSKLLDHAPKRIVKMCRKGALLLHPPHHCALHIRPNDPREKRLPKDLIMAVYRLAGEKKIRNRRTRPASTRSCSGMELGDIRLSRLYSTASANDNNKQQLNELVAELKRFSSNFGTRLDALTNRIESISRDIDTSNQLFRHFEALYWNLLLVSLEYHSARMSEHRGTSFAHSCVKVPVDPYSRQPTPSYERPKILKNERCRSADKSRKINFANRDNIPMNEQTSPHETLENFLEFLESIPDYGDVHHLTNEQFKQKVDYLKRKQRVLLKNLRYCLDQDVNDKSDLREHTPEMECSEVKQWCTDYNNLSLKGKKCNFEESRVESPILFSSGKFAGLAEDQDLLTYRCKGKDKDAKTLRNREIHSARKSWSTWSESKSMDSPDTDEDDDSIETRSLPPSSPKRWHPTVPKPFSFTLREDAEKYMSLTEMQAEDCLKKETLGVNKKPTKRRRTKPVPLTSKLRLYDKLLAEKEERSRMVREESAWSLMSQVRPFKLESARRALTRSSPELCPVESKDVPSVPKFRAKPVPRNLFSTEVYDRMLEDDFYRALKKKVRAAELLKSSSLPPSMARRERVKSANTDFQNNSKDYIYEKLREGRESTGASVTPLPSERSRSVMTVLSGQGNNLAAILRCQASREKMEREIQEKMEERRREEIMKLRESLVRRKPAWRALRSATRHEHERDLILRASLRRDEAREQAERHRLQMELMLDRVTQIPTLFERHSQEMEYLQSFHTPLSFPSKVGAKCLYKTKKKKRAKRDNSSSVNSYASLASSSRPNSGSLTSSSGTLGSISRSSKSSGSRKSSKSTPKSSNSTSKKKGDRGPLKVSINETAELIEDQNEEDERYSSDPIPSDEHEQNVSDSEENESVEN